MPNKPLRASQFLAFDALKGFQEILKEQEKSKEKKKVLSEEEEKEINQELTKYTLVLRTNVEITYYWISKYITIKGIITKIDIYLKQFTILNRKIPFQDLIQLKILEK